MDYNQQRERRLNRARIAETGDYVLYWIQAYRRLQRNHALERAIRFAAALRKPLVIFEQLRLDDPWASPRSHRFVLAGMLDNAAVAERLGLNYWPMVETPHQPVRGLPEQLASRAALVVTDDFPGLVVPARNRSLARRVRVPVVAVDGNGLVPLSLLGPAASAAAHFRPRLHRALVEAWWNRTATRLRIPAVVRRPVSPPFETWRGGDLDRLLEQLPFEAQVPPVTGAVGGRSAARRRLRDFVAHRLKGYAEARSLPAPPDAGHASGLSPYLHFGHISIDEVAEAVLGPDWSTESLRFEARGKRQGFFGPDPDVNAFLDQALTWRDLGFHWHLHRGDQAARLERALPAWVLETLGRHAGDRRAHVYAPEEWEAGATHDPLWNAAQRELVATGTIHNYLRMLWGKKVIEFSRSCDQAYSTLVRLNNTYALDGCDPNSGTGILWCFGLFDRPWAPQRPVFGSVRYMSSENTARKFRLSRYLDYVASLPTIAEVRAGLPRVASTARSRYSRLPRADSGV